MERALGYIGERFRSITSAAEVAEAAGVGVSQLNRIARVWTGQSIMESVRRVRVEHARKLLAEPTLSIKEVAAACGFADPYHFSKVFRKIDGLPPSEYRASVLKISGMGWIVASAREQSGGVRRSGGK